MYTINVTSGVSDTTWVSLNQKTISWSASSFVFVGTHTITITGTLPNGQSGHASFDLIVGATCATSDD